MYVLTLNTPEVIEGTDIATCFAASMNFWVTQRLCDFCQTAQETMAS